MEKLRLRLLYTKHGPQGPANLLLCSLRVQSSLITQGRWEAWFFTIVLLIFIQEYTPGEAGSRTWVVFPSQGIMSMWRCLLCAFVTTVRGRPLEASDTPAYPPQGTWTLVGEVGFISFSVHTVKPIWSLQRWFIFPWSWNSRATSSVDPLKWTLWPQSHWPQREKESLQWC